MRRKDREMNKEFAEYVVDKCSYATLATVDINGNPYCIPISIVREKDKIYFHCAYDGDKTNNMRDNPNVCISCVGETNIPEGEFTTEYESAVLFGRAKEVSEPEDKIYALKLLCLRYTPNNMDNFEDAINKSLNRTAVWQVTIDNITGKRKKYDSNGIEMKFGRMTEDEA